MVGTLRGVSDVAAAPTRDRGRRGKILRAATQLFRERGFHAVGIDEIGSAAGITGPGVYRHFSGKEDLLIAVFEHATDELWQDLEPDAPADLERYVRSHVAITVAHADAIELWYQEGRNLPKAARANQARIQRRYLERWVEALREVRPALGEDEARSIVRATIGLIHSAAYNDQTASPEVLRPLLERLALAVLRA